MTTIRTKTATTARNDIVKTFDGWPVRSTYSNPYTTRQSLSATISRKNAKELQRMLNQQGFTKHVGHLQESFVKRGGAEFRKGGLSILVSHNGHVTVTGPKKAKRITLPYYD